MKPIANTIVGYIEEEPNMFNHGRWVGDRPTFFLRVYYPQKREEWTKNPRKSASIAFRTRKFPFVIHPRILEEVKSKGPWKGQFVVVTYYIETVERLEEARVLLYATDIHPLLEDFPEVKLDQGNIWIDANSIEEDIKDVEI